MELLAASRVFEKVTVDTQLIKRVRQRGRETSPVLGSNDKLGVWLLEVNDVGEVRIEFFQKEVRSLLSG